MSIDPDRLLNARELAYTLGVPETWVREHTRAGNIPHVRLGRYARYRREDVEAWLERCTRKGRPVSFRRAA